MCTWRSRPKNRKHLSANKGVVQGDHRRGWGAEQGTGEGPGQASWRTPQEREMQHADPLSGTLEKERPGNQWSPHRSQEAEKEQ